MHETINMLILFYFEKQVTSGTKIEEVRNILSNICINEDQKQLNKFQMTPYEIISGTASAISGILTAAMSTYLNGQGEEDDKILPKELFIEYERGYPIYETISKLAEEAHLGDENKQNLFNLILADRENESGT